MRAALRSLVVLLLLLLAPAAVSAQDDAWQQAQGQEKILNYLSEVTVAPSGDLDVTETIRIVALSQQIRHGIYRDFPTSYADNLGHRLHVGFSVVSVQRDEKDEPWSREGLSNGVRVRIGSADITLAPYIHRWFAMPIERPSMPSLERWYATIKGHTGCAKHVCVELA